MSEVCGAVLISFMSNGKHLTCILPPEHNEPHYAEDGNANATWEVLPDGSLLTHSAQFSVK